MTQVRHMRGPRTKKGHRRRDERQEKGRMRRMEEGQDEEQITQSVKKKHLLVR